MAEITRADAAALLSEQKVTDIVDTATVGSVVLNTFETVPMSKKVLRQPLLASLPDAHFVTDGTSDGQSAASGTKPTTSMSWTDKSMTAEEIAVIVPVHENLLEDSDVDIWAQVRPKIAEAFAIRLDLAVLYGVEAPASWTDADLVGKAITAGNLVASGTATLEQGGLAEDFNQLFAEIEDDGYDVTDVFAIKRLRSRLRGLRDANGQPIYLDGVRSDNNTSSIYGQNLRWLHKRVEATADVDGAGAGTPVQIESLAVDASQFQVGIREDFTVKFLDQATVNGINLAERDMVAMRFKFRVAFGSFRSPLLHEGDDYPVAVLHA